MAALLTSPKSGLPTTDGTESEPTRSTHASIAKGGFFFAPYCCDNEFMLDGFNSMSTTSTGVWYYGGFGGIVEQGRFVAERLDSGK
jgi:hypothetical protein